MAKKKNRKKESFFTRLRNKYRLVILNDETFEEKISLRLSRLNVFLVVSVVAVLLIISTTLLIAYTPLKEYIPGYASTEMRRNVITLVSRADSLEYALALKDQKMSIIRAIIEGENPDSITYHADSASFSTDTLKFEPSPEDSMLRAAVEEEDRFNLQNQDRPIDRLALMVFHSPVNGVITNGFNPREKHFGVDVVSTENSPIKNILNGTVILSDWTPETGHVISVQHSNSLISIYKHNSVVLKSVGEYVKAGEVIAIIGNTGELTTGPHLHFELWQNGKPLDPENYLLF